MCVLKLNESEFKLFCFERIFFPVFSSFYTQHKHFFVIIFFSYKTFFIMRVEMCHSCNECAKEIDIFIVSFACEFFQIWNVGENLEKKVTTEHCIIQCWVSFFYVSEFYSLIPFYVAFKFMFMSCELSDFFWTFKCIHSFLTCVVKSLMILQR